MCYDFDLLWDIYYCIWGMYLNMQENTYVLYFIYDYCFIYYTDIYDLVCNVLKYEHIPWVINVFKSRKIFKACYGFRVLYVFPFPSAGHWIIGSGRDKVGIRAWVFIADFQIIVLCFYYTTAVLGCQMSVLSSLLPVFCVVSVLLSCLILFGLSSLNEENTRYSCCWST